jgi:hypothetical protein
VSKAVVFFFSRGHLCFLFLCSLAFYRYRIPSVRIAFAVNRVSIEGFGMNERHGCNVEFFLHSANPFIFAETVSYVEPVARDARLPTEAFQREIYSTGRRVLQVLYPGSPLPLLSVQIHVSQPRTGSTTAPRRLHDGVRLCS